MRYRPFRLKCISSALAEPGRFIVFTTPIWERCSQPGYAQFQAEQIEHAHRRGIATEPCEADHVYYQAS